ncbi:MAG: hypothetical protein NVSMB23_13770 [Myxococcales bacterium]
MPARPPELRKYRLAVYGAYGLVCALLFYALLRSVVGDLYGRGPSAGAPPSATACLEDLDRLYAQVAARAVQPAPRGLEAPLLAREWDLWSSRWQVELDQVSARCQLDEDRKDPARADLASARESLEELRRELSRTGDAASQQARRVKDSLAAARLKLGR